MSYRTRRGRYPKGSALHQPSNTQMSQQPGTGGMTYSHASEVPFYNVQQTAQIAQKYSSLKRKENVIYTNTPCMPSTTQPETNAWDWTPHTVTETVVSRQPPVAAPPAIFQPQYFRPEIPSSQYQDPNIQQHPSQQQQQQLNYQQPPQQQQLSYQQPPHQQQQQLNYQQPPQQQQEQLNYQQPPQQQQQLNYQQPQQQLNYQQPPQQQEQLNHQQPVNNLYNSQNYVSEPLPVSSSSSYPVQNSWYTPSNGDVGNQDCEQSIPEVQQIDPWEPTIPNISQAQQIQWTYNVPQNTMPSESSWQNPDISTNSVPVNSTHWNHQSANHWVQKEENSSNSIENHHDKNNSMPQDLNSLPVSNTGTLENAQFHSYQDNIENLKTDPVSLNTTYADSVHSISENLYVEEPESGTVNTFFGDSLEENIPIPNEQLPPQIPHLDSLEIGQMEDQMADLSIVQPHTPLISESNDSPSQQLIEETLPDPNSFLQKEVDSEQPEAISFPPSSSTEEPLNQEVPEPHDSQCITPVPRDGVSNQILEEPLNQQVPEKTEDSRPCEGRKPTPERISDVNAIGHREGSPFKPPTKLKNSTAPIVQQESSNVAMESPPKDDIGIHGVNLETLPDNLERPFDQDRPQRQYRSSRLRRCLREGDDESPEKHLDTSSTSLLDSPDIPCITFALAAPPVSPSHSHRTKSSTPPVTDGSEHEDSQSTLVATKSQGIIEIANMNSTPSYEKSSISMAQNESSVTPTPHPVYTKPEPILTIAQPLLIPTLPSLPATPSHSSNRDHDLDVSSSFDQSSEYDQKEERKSDSRRGSFKTSSPIKELKSFEPVPPEKFRHERESQGYSRNYPASEKDDSHSSSSRDQSNRRHYRDYENHAPENREGPVDRNYSRQRFAENRQPTSFDDRAYSDRDGSRPSSRMSLNETGDNRTYRDNGYRKQYASDYERPPSRVSESEAYGSNKRRSHRDYDRDSQYYREEEYYRRQRQYGEYDYDPYAQAGNPYYRYYYPYGYNYNYGFYDELYRNDPRYKQQMEDQYREYYRRLGYETDPERLSVHSGRSSANELARDMRYPEPDGHSNESEYSSYVQQGDTYSEDQHSTPSTRLTPSKFSCPHPIARFSNNGMLITLIPKLHSTEHSAFVEIHDVQVFAQDLETYEELKSYEGPLVRGATHKNDIIDFCLRKIKFYKQKVGIPDRESYILLWELLVLLLRQNGSVAGSDIAELLLKNHEILYPQLNKLEDTTQSVNSPTDGVENPVGVQTGDNSSPDEGIVVARDRTILNANHNMDPDKLIRKYREFLLFGHKKDALEYAVKQGLWSHALFLASKMDMRTYSSVLMRFTNSLTLNDPLQSLYQLMSGRQPTAVTSIADKQWGDWRPHLAMILSNPSSNPENDSKSITTLGDTLAVQGCLPAAHFCYLMAQVEFGYFSSKSSKMVLLGANHLLPFETFATNEAIQCTEIYEYAQSLANPGFVLNHLQAYKFLYAMNLVDHGLLPEALRYCEVLASSFISSPYSVSLGLITQVYELASKLKFHDPYYLPGSMELEPDEDPEWLKLFSTTLQNLQNNVPYQSDSEDVPSDGTTNAENLKEENDSPQELNNTDIQNQNYYNNESQQNYYNQETQNYYVNNNSWTGENNTIPNNQINTYDNQTTQPNYNQYSNNTQTTQWNLNSQQQKISEQYQGNESIESTTEASPLSTTLPAQPSPPSFTTNKFDFHGTNNNQQVYSSRERTSSVSSFGYQKDRHDSNVSSGSDYAAGTTTQSSTLKKKSTDDRVIGNKEDKSRQQVGRSWLGGIFNRLLPKAPNQMILPDDKNPTIVWDPVKKNWINTDGSETEDSLQPVAPPTDTELLNQTSSSDIPSSMPSIPSPPSTLMSNRFKRAKGKGTRDYIDVLNPMSPATKTNALPDALFPSPMPLQTQSPQLFIPSGPTSDDRPVDFVSTGQAYITSSQGDDEDASVPDAPIMYDPAEFDSRRSNVNTLRHSVGPARRTYPT